MRMQAISQLPIVPMYNQPFRHYGLDGDNLGLKAHSEHGVTIVFSLMQVLRVNGTKSITECEL